MQLIQSDHDDLDCTGCMKSVSFGTSTAAAARCPNAFLI
nr:MAG TPA: hypothetical protein [Caudoviricetes sp.]DAU83128.1 MAG TPA: hypothetical protein [Caudoviricetes sp.]DAV35290.1 MAG TPA: hypothetical protein [Caudoviricetes sp.]DAW13830.1 MAG TPA: hypothetical protein [Caudoviricetes sp.]DAZ50866.1 MAG TPA: hypothetical protein [Caudoviricetes sp.]